jgi:hypothetical protein
MDQVARLLAVVHLGEYLVYLRAENEVVHQQKDGNADQHDDYVP